MTVLIAVKGNEGSRFYRAASSLIGGNSEAIVLAHVVDTSVREEFDMRFERHGRRALPAARQAELNAADEERARSVLDAACAQLVQAGVDEGRLRSERLEGKPREALVRFVERERVELVVVGARPNERVPHSVGKTARFVLDHVCCSALLIR